MSRLEALVQLFLKAHAEVVRVVKGRFISLFSLGTSLVKRKRGERNGKELKGGVNDGRMG